MIHIITQENRALFRRELTQMHAQRKRLFVDEMGWRLTVCAGLEIDAFDSERAIYLVELSGRTVVQSVRLLPTREPHLLADVFSMLCPGGPPRSERIWEVSRFCPAPETPRGEARRRLLMRMIAAMMETGLLFGVTDLTFVASAALRPLAARAGWDVQALGPSQRVGADKLTAMQAKVSSAGLEAVRAIHGFDGPLTRYVDADLRRAA